MSKQKPLSLEDHLFELPGTPQAWLWVHTCPRPKCECRTALVLASHAGREMLIERGAFIHAAQGAGVNCNHAAGLLEDVLVFSLDIDTAEILSTADQELLDLSRYPEIADVAHRIDGDVLEWIGRLWYRGKGELDPEQRVLQADRITVRGWQIGNLLAWNELCSGVRRDLYVVDGVFYEADELYCPVPECNCGEVLVDFELRGTDEATHVGSVRVRRSGEIELVATRRRSSDLQRLWADYRRRHPRYAERIERREAIVKRIGARFVPKAPASRTPGKVGRNDACPCGSGRKFKKCCGSASAIRAPARS